MGRDSEAGHVRDKRNGKWWWCHNAIIDEYGPVLGPFGIAVYTALCRYASDDGSCWPSVATIAHDTGMSTNRVRRSLSDLKKAGLIEIEYRKEDDVNQTSIYTLLEVMQYPTPDSTSPHAVPTSPREVPIPHIVKEGTSPREAKKDTIKKTQLEKDTGKRVAADAAAPVEEKPAKPSKPERAKTVRLPGNGNKRTPAEHALCEELVDGMCEVSGMTRQTNNSVLYTAGWMLVNLLQAGITPSKAQIIRAFGRVDPGPRVWWWYRDDQRPKMDKAKGLAPPIPKPPQIAEMYTVSLQPLVSTTVPPSDPDAFERAKARRAAENAEPQRRPTKTSRELSSYAR